MYFFEDDFGKPVSLTFDEEIYRQRPAQHVLIFPFHNGKLLFTVHTLRGIELPGGKVEPGETSMAAAVRETYEETGCTLTAIEKIGQYVVDHTLVKDIFVARVEEKVAEMREGTVGGTVMFDEIPEDVKGDPRFSRFLYDDVYPLTLSYLRSHNLIPAHAARP
ncbi:NUDIX domain-containing protein [Brevibacillus humidisoli]|uniref:NUDIX domain-containing protein n=1 Tax=Brevibacillus humidisoli TaxID=2895522 RepID=UPI001E49AD22|nr:NUDIX domain-containing protein [Brevibacillus humidisoli]UFJ41947.1 NUDIX domain-containing protein [Brevibacillus humidisoli]